MSHDDDFFDDSYEGEPGFSEGGYDDEGDFDYDQFIDEEFSEGLTNTETSTMWRTVSVALLFLAGGFVAWRFSIAVWGR